MPGMQRASKFKLGLFVMLVLAITFALFGDYWTFEALGNASSSSALAADKVNTLNGSTVILLSKKVSALQTTVVPYKAVADKVVADKAVAGKAVADKAAADKVVAAKVVALQTTVDMLVADKAVADKVVADKPVADKPVASKEEDDPSLLECIFKEGRNEAFCKSQISFVGD